MPETDKLLKDKLSELKAERDGRLAKSAPLRAERDRIKNEAREQCKALEEQIREAEDGLCETENEIGRVAKALGGRSMSGA